METKKWYQSKILWAGIAMVLTGVSDAVIQGASWRSIGMAAFGALVAFLRTITTSSITLTGKETK